MILLKLNSLITTPIYIGSTVYRKKKFTNYIYKKYNNKYIFNIFLILKYLSKAYLYLYILSKYNRSLLFVNFSIKNFNLIKSLANLTNNFYINFFYKIDFLFNWIMFKNKLILLKWLKQLYTLYLKYLFMYLPYNLLIKLYLIYINISKKLDGVEYMQKLPENIFICGYNYNNLYKNLNLKNFLIISIIDINNENMLKNISIKILGNSQNYLAIKFIFNILLTALLHGSLFNK
ncbi:putative ribosomal protein S2 (apicoplast) [Besnoitia besnoiti]|uniref:Putative ribosomal protein S2 n=1 Tax=Besnoitia besnoiti TaxID=94643 RepID=A0A2A9M5B7_BESBE|nr:putative ribosomal protein S2 [Besnoitia besnoiti]PFH30582.1 putative ribosomal protein S2 [Besnoitia besnoiti]